MLPAMPDRDQPCQIVPPAKVQYLRLAYVPHKQRQAGMDAFGLVFFLCARKYCGCIPGCMDLSTKRDPLQLQGPSPQPALLSLGVRVCVASSA